MAQNGDYEIVTGAVDARRVSKGGTNTAQSATPDSYVSVDAMKTRLAAINGTYYTAARLNQMSINDMVYAIRVADDAGSIK